jgi:hypothetical protein
MFKVFLAVFTFCFLNAVVMGQSIIIEGQVASNLTHAPIPFASVFVKGTNIKVATDVDGNYKLRLKHAADYIGVSCTGYKTILKRASKSVKEQTINFALVTADSTLKQKSSLTRNELNAIDIIRKVIDRKTSHAKSKFNAYGYEAYTRIQMDLVDMNDKFKNRKLFRPFKFVFNNIDSASQIKPFLPFFLSETVSDYYYQKKNLAGREIIKASKISGVTDVNISQFLGTSYSETDIYDKYIVILKREFLSPLSEAGIKSYNFYLEDSQVINKIKCYRIRFVPKSPKLLRLEGEMLVADTIFAIKQINLIVRGSSNINLINSISLHNEYFPVRDSVWMLKRENLTINFARTKDRPEMILRKDAFFNNFIVNADKRSIDSLFRNGRPDISVSDSAKFKSEGYWQRIRKAAANTQDENKVYNMIDTLAGLKATRNYINLLQTVFEGFANAGPISIGNLYTLVGLNLVQGWHFRLDLRTNEFFSKSVRLGAFAGYGILDKKVRYGGDILWVIKKYPRISVFASYKYIVTPNANASQFFNPPEFFTTYGLRRVEDGSFILLKLMDNREIKFRFYEEFKFGYSYAIAFSNQTLQPLQNFNFSYLTAADNLNPNTNINTITNTEFSITQRFAWKERFVGNNFNRLSLGSKFPLVILEYAFGVKRVLGSDFSYQKIAVKLNDTRLLGPLGKLRWHIEAGKIFGTLPYLLLQSPNASETYISWWPGFNTISQYQFTADRYVEAMIDHHLEGLIFDRIPGLNKLKWREVWSARMWWGDLTNANYTANYANLADNVNNTGLVRVQTADKTPFVEMSAGIENIFTFFRLETVWRVTHLDPDGSRFSFRYGNFGVRLAFEVQF